MGRARLNSARIPGPGGARRASGFYAKKALADGGAAARASTFVVYPDAPHAFHADYRPSYRQEAAEDGWKRALDWFQRHGVA